MSFASKSALVAAFTAALGAIAAAGPADAACRGCQKPIRVVAGKTTASYSVSRPVRVVTRYRDLYRISYVVKVSRVVSRAEYLRFKRSCGRGCAVPRR